MGQTGKNPGAGQSGQRLPIVSTEGFMGISKVGRGIRVS